MAGELMARRSGFTLTTDVIVGFPGESEEDFLETPDVIKRVRFAKVHMFPFSPRERTRAALYPNRAPKRVMNERRQRVMEPAEAGARALREGCVGEVMEVLMENGGMGHTGNFLPVRVEGKAGVNELVRVKMKRNESEYLVGRVV